MYWDQSFKQFIKLYIYYVPNCNAAIKPCCVALFYFW